MTVSRHDPPATQLAAAAFAMGSQATFALADSFAGFHAWVTYGMRCALRPTGLRLAGPWHLSPARPSRWQRLQEVVASRPPYWTPRVRRPRHRASFVDQRAGG